MYVLYRVRNHLLMLKAAIAFPVLLLWSHCVPAASTDLCPPGAIVQGITKATGLGATLSVNINAYRSIGKEFFGFNVESVGFQDDMWDSTARTVKPMVVEWLRPFDGAVYRYPGGTIANHFDWSATIGPVASRPAQRLVEWKGPIVMDFGFDEFLHFVETVQGRPWIVINLYGQLGKEAHLADLIRRAGRWAEYSEKRAKLGAPRILKWELGNELDRGRYQWPSDKYIQAARAAAREIKAASSSAEFVALMMDYEAQKAQRAADYNRSIVTGLTDITKAFAVHLYFDGRPSAPAVPNRLGHVCEVMRIADAVSKPGESEIWVTEYARWPPGRAQDPEWRKGWSRSSDLEAAIAVADAMIGATQIPAVRGMFLHSLGAAHGPWTLFHDAGSGQLRTSAVYLALRLLRESVEDRALVTISRSEHESGYFGGYDVRGTVLSSREQRRLSIWAINRSQEPKLTGVIIPSLASKRITGTHRYISHADIGADNSKVADTVRIMERKVDLQFDLNGRATFTLPPHSVSAVQVGIE